MVIIKPKDLQQQSIYKQRTFGFNTYQKPALKPQSNVFSVCSAQFLSPPGCPDIFPGPRCQEVPQILQVETFLYNAISDGIKHIYTNADELTQYGNNGILNPNSVSYMNLFINGILQPSVNYQVQEGLLILTTPDVPENGVSISLQFIRIIGSSFQ